MRWLALLPLTLTAAPVADLHVKVPLRDGVELCANLWRPAAAGRFPVLLVRTPYRKAAEPTPAIEYYLSRGYAVVAQDVRGRFDSGGVFRQFEQEAADGEDTLNWIARQPWCDGNIGMFGASYAGLAQWRAALSGHPALKAIAPGTAGWDEYTDRFYSPGGAFRLAHRLLWLAENMRRPGWPMPELPALAATLPVREADRVAAGARVDFFQAALDHPTYDYFWRARSTREQIGRVRAAVHISGGWFDAYAASDVAAWQALCALGRPARLLIGPWGHSLATPVAGADFGPAARVSLAELQAAWFDAWLKPSAGHPPGGARMFLMGENRWVELPEWPPAAKETSFYLRWPSRTAVDGVLRERAGGGEPSRGFRYDPANPVPTIGGAPCCNPKLLPPGPLDQAPLHGRKDVLSFYSAPLRQPLAVLGAVRAMLYVASSAPDTDFTAKLVDVSPGGPARIITDGILRLRYRRGVEHAAPYTPTTPEAIEIAMAVTGHVFLPGHRLRLDISSSNFPRFDRNPNTGRPVADERSFAVAEQTVYHSRRRPSRLILPVWPADGPRKTLDSAARRQ